MHPSETHRRRSEGCRGALRGFEGILLLLPPSPYIAPYSTTTLYTTATKRLTKETKKGSYRGSDLQRCKLGLGLGSWVSAVGQLSGPPVRGAYVGKVISGAIFKC